ncbi:DNA repair protein RecO [Halalkalibacillus halophilus]|uniref:DNA repair protein RecO n=1 Tax=Halalkalibacillus halophilus TaxID=392827 RepID=UPI00040C2E8C|nr:DNA repair protein RecO [Halalkalibacillus halophilus]
MFEKVHGIVLRTRDYGETNKIVTLYTKEYGLMSAVAKGAKKSRSRMAAVTQPFIYGQYIMHVGKGLGSLQQGEPIDSMRAIREDIVKTAYATYMSELLMKSLEEKEPISWVFEELQVSLEKIADNQEALAITCMFELKMYRVSGISPMITSCVNGHDNSPIVSFSIAEGGVLCQQCRFKDTTAIPLEANTYRVLRMMHDLSVKQIRDVQLKQETLVAIRNILEGYYDWYGSIPIKSRKFLKQLHLFESE